MYRNNKSYVSYNTFPNYNSNITNLIAKIYKKNTDKKV